MIRQQWMRFIKSQFNIVILLGMILVTAINFYGTYLDQADLLSQLKAPSADFNVEAAKILADGYCGLSYVANYLFSSDFYILTVLLLLLGFSGVIGDTAVKNLRSGYGNFLVLRQGYRKYMGSLLQAECRYITFFIWTYFAVLVLGAMILWPAESGTAITMNVTNQIYSAPGALAVFSVHVGLLNLYICLLFSVSAQSDVWLQNKYFIQVLPCLLHMIPILLASSLGNLNDFFAKLFTVVNPDVYLFSVRTFLSTDLHFGQILLTAISVPALLAALFLIAYRANLGKREKEYL